MKYIPFLIIIIIPFIFYYFRKRSELRIGAEKNEGTLPQKKHPKLWLYAGVVTLMLVMTLGDADYSLKNGLLMQVNISAKEYSTRHSFELSNHNQLVSGASGQLHWQPENFMEALLLNTTGGHGVMNIFDVLLLYIIIGLFYFMTLGSGKKSVFSGNLTGGFMLIFFLIAISGQLKGMEYNWVSHYVEKITNGQFTLQPQNTSSFFYLQLGTMLFFMLRFARQALDMQKEQELTI